jgi:hypothetical protein
MSALIKLYSGDGVVRLLNNNCARGIAIPGSYARIRVGMRLRIDGAANITTPSLYLGICSGRTNIPGDASATHWLGAHSAGSWTYGTQYASGSINSAKLVGTTLTTGGGFGSGYDFCNTASGFWTGMFVDIIKGSPNYTLAFLGFDTTINSGNSLTPATFYDMMGIPGNLPAVGGWYFSSGAVAVNEGVDGTFDSVAAFWSNASYAWEFSDLAFSTLSS